MAEWAAVVVVLALFTTNEYFAIRWWQRYHDLRAIRGLVTGGALLVGACALGVATYALHNSGPDEIIETLRLLVAVGQGVLLLTGVALVYSIFREGRTA